MPHRCCLLPPPCRSVTSANSPPRNTDVIAPCARPTLRLVVLALAQLKWPTWLGLSGCITRRHDRTRTARCVFVSYESHKGEQYNFKDFKDRV